MSWIDEKHWSDRFLPEIKAILGLHLIGEPPQEEDAERNTDLIVLRMEPVRIACRVRRHKYYLEWPDDITVRAGLPSGAKTELTKIIEGWGDFFFYGFADAEESRLLAWRLIALKAFRLWFMRHLATHAGKQPGTRRENKDRSSWFYAYAVNSFPAGVVLAHHP